MQDLYTLLPIVGIALLFWLFIVRPASRRQKEVRTLQNSLAVGQEVLLASGLYGVIRSLEDTTVGLEIADGVVVKAARGSVVQVSDGGTQGDGTAETGAPDGEKSL